MPSTWIEHVTSSSSDWRYSQLSYKSVDRSDAQHPRMESVAAQRLDCSRTCCQRSGIGRSVAVVVTKWTTGTMAEPTLWVRTR